MTDRELLQQTLDAWDTPGGINYYDFVPYIESIRAGLAQPEPEPVAWGILNTRPTEKQPLMMVMLDEPEPSHLVVPLYTAPPQREWQGLTYADLYFWGGELGIGELGKGVLRAVDAHLREKNNSHARTKKEWQGLTREELAEIAEFHFHGVLSGREFYDDIEAKLKEKNSAT